MFIIVSHFYYKHFCFHNANIQILSNKTKYFLKRTVFFISYNKITAACTEPRITPIITPAQAHIRSCFSFSEPLDLSKAHLAQIAISANITDQTIGNRIMKKIVSKAELSKLIIPSSPSHLYPSI